MPFENVMNYEKYKHTIRYAHYYTMIYNSAVKCYVHTNFSLKLDSKKIYLSPPRYCSKKVLYFALFNSYNFHHEVYMRVS